MFICREKISSASGTGCADPDGGGRRPVAYARWAYVGNRQKARLDAGNKRLAPGDWKSGNHKVIIDVIIPFGGRNKILEEIGGVKRRPAILSCIIIAISALIYFKNNEIADYTGLKIFLSKE